MISIFSKISVLKVGLLLDISNQIRYEVPSGQFTGFTLNYETAGLLDIHLV